MEILCYPNPFLRKKSRDIKNVSDEDRKILSDMAETMYVKGGVGLASIQVGIDKSMIVLDIGSGLMKLVNPAIVKRDGNETQEEGCLSVPDKCVHVKRAKNIIVEYLDESGQPHRLAAAGLLARVIQHENDHLSGKLIIDYLSPLKKLCNSLTTRKL